MNSKAIEAAASAIVRTRNFNGNERDAARMVLEQNGEQVTRRHLNKAMRLANQEWNARHPELAPAEQPRFNAKVARRERLAALIGE